VVEHTEPVVDYEERLQGFVPEVGAKHGAKHGEPVVDFERLQAQGVDPKLALCIRFQCWVWGLRCTIVKEAPWWRYIPESVR
jgi:hypothetical protein